MYKKNGVIRKGLIVRNPMGAWEHPARAYSPYGEDAGLGYKGYGSPYGFYGATQRKCLSKGASGADVKLLQDKLQAIAYADSQSSPSTVLGKLYFKGIHPLTGAVITDDTDQYLWAVKQTGGGNAISDTDMTYVNSKGESYGKYKEPTQVAVMAFQKQQGIGVDGVAGPTTWAKLGEVGKSCGGGGGSGSGGGSTSSSGSSGSGTSGAIGSGFLADQGIWPFDFQKAMKSWIVWTTLGGLSAVAIAVAATRKKSPKEQEALKYDALTVMSNPLAALQLGGSYRTNPHCTAGLKPNPKKRRNRRKKRKSRKRRR